MFECGLIAAAPIDQQPRDLRRAWTVDHSIGLVHEKPRLGYDDDTVMDGFGFHAGFGYIVILLGLIFMLIGVAAGIGKWRLGRHGLLFLLLFIQLWLAWIGFEVPFPVGFLHPINAMLILSLSSWISWDEWQRRKAGSAPPPAEAAAA